MAGYICKIVIEDTHPPVWRRVLVPEHITFKELHDIIRVLFGWEDSHLHEFLIPSDYITIGSEEINCGNHYDEEETLVDSFFRNYKWIRYIYDFGDDWRHKINIEKVDFDYTLREVTLLKFKGDNFEEDCGGVWGANETSRNVFLPDYVKEKLKAMKLPSHEELQETPLLKEAFGQFKELVQNLMQLEPEVLQSQLAGMANEIHEGPSNMALKVKELRMYEESTKPIRLVQPNKSQMELLLELGDKEAADYYKYLRIPQKGVFCKQEMVEEISQTLREHPEYILYVLKENEYREVIQWLKYMPERYLPETKNGNMLAKLLGLGLADFSIDKTGASFCFATDTEELIGKIDKKLQNETYKFFDKFDERLSNLVLAYGAVERESLYKIYKKLYEKNIEKEDFFRYIYWHAKYNCYVNTSYNLEGDCFISQVDLDMQNIFGQMEIYAKQLPYVEFSRQEISYMGEDLANRSEWVDILVSSLHYQLGMDWQDAQVCLYWIIDYVLNGYTLNDLLIELEEENKARWSLETSTELWTILSGLMLEFELPMLKGRSRMNYAKEQKCSPWSVGMVEEAIVSMSIKHCPMHLFSSEIQECMYEAVNFGEKDCIIKLLDYKEKQHICSEEYLYLLAEACIDYGYTKEAEKVLTELNKGSVSGKRVAKKLKTRLQQRCEIVDDEEDYFECWDWEQRFKDGVQEPYVRDNPKIGRNDPCPCGSGKKFKKCCGK